MHFCLFYRGEGDEGRPMRCGSGAYIEVVKDTYTTPPLPRKLHESLKTLYAT